MLVGRSPALGNATKISYLSHLALVDDLKPGDHKVLGCIVTD